jgi:CheY-like chemotaxis protein
VRHFKCFDAVMQIVRFTSGAADALRKIEEQNFDFILIEFQMPEWMASLWQERLLGERKRLLSSSHLQ